MKLIYRAKDITEAHIISGLLKSKGVEAYVGGHYLQGGVGDLAAMDFATISVADADAGTAISIIAEYESSTSCESDKGNDKSIFTMPLIVIVLTVIMMLLLAISFSDYS